MFKKLTIIHSVVALMHQLQANMHCSGKHNEFRAWEAVGRGKLSTNVQNHCISETITLHSLILHIYTFSSDLFRINDHKK